MDITEIAKLIGKMTGLDKKEQEQLENFIDQFDDIDEINSFSDLEDIDFSDLDIDGLDLDEFDIEPGAGFDMGDIGSGLDGWGGDRRSGRRSVDDYRHNPSKEDESKEQIDVEIPDDHDEEDDPYQGNTWMEVEDEKFEAFVQIPDEIDGDEIGISLRSDSVEISEPIGETLETKQLPADVENLDAEVTEGGRLLVRTW